MRIITFMFLIIQVASASATIITGRTIRVTDGDTIVILSEGNTQHKIRLQGIDAPERGQAFGKKSKSNLSSMVAGKFVIVEYNKRDRYGRIVGKVFVGDKDVCLEQVRAGLAWHYKKYQGEQSPRDRDSYAEAETEARQGMWGLWKEPFPIPPWDWRRGQRGHSVKRQVQPTGEAFLCGTKRFCREMVSCEEAKFYLHNCALTRLDGDNDGIPCESLCK